MERSPDTAGWPLSALGLRGRPEPVVVVLGLARSGLAAAQLLASRGARLRLLGLAAPESPSQHSRLEALQARGATLRLGPHDLEELHGADLIVKSPGVPAEIPFLRAAREAGVPVVGELEIASLAAAGPIVAITGTNGKSTTTAWVGHMLGEAGILVEVAGNIGRPMAEAVLDHPKATFVVEVSSFQLEDTRTFHPRVATLLNLTPDHLDRHGSMAAYAEAKSRIFRNQSPEDTAVLGPDAELDPFIPSLRARVLRIGRPGVGRSALDSAALGSAALDSAASGSAASGSAAPGSAVGAVPSEGVRLEGDLLVLHLGRPGSAATTDRPDQERASAHPQQPTRAPLLRIGELALPGAHNVANAMAAAATAAAAGASVSAIVQSLRTFPGLPHRLEPVGEIAGVLCINDSKATNVGSLQVALEAFPDPVHLIAGGVGKGQDFRPLATSVRERTRSVHLIGESGDDLARAWTGADIRRADDLGAALDGALALAHPGERVLLSPGCASFDMFRDFEDRGDQFRALVTARAEARGGFDE